MTTTMIPGSDIPMRPKGQPIPNYDDSLCWNCQAEPRGGCSDGCAYCELCCMAFNIAYPQPTRQKKS